jgi:hypothetical protein
VSKVGAIAGCESQTRTRTRAEADKITELYKLMALGDYEGIIAIAKKLNASKEAKSSPARRNKHAEIRSDTKEQFRPVGADDFKNIKLQKHDDSEYKSSVTSPTLQQRQNHLMLENDSNKLQSSILFEIAPVDGSASDHSKSRQTGKSVSDDASSASDNSSDASESIFAHTAVCIPPILNSSKEKTSSSSPSSSSDTDGPRIYRQRSALELAVELGDWEAVSDAAAMLSDTSIQSEPSELAMSSKLDDLISRGDWSGVVNVANSRILSDHITTAENAH